MSSLALVDATTWVDGYDFTTDLNQITLAASVDELDSTTFGGGGFRSKKGGLKTVEGMLAGFWDSAADEQAPDPQAFGHLGARNRVVTMSPTGVEGEVAYFYRAGHFTYQAFGSIGDLTPFSLDVKGTDAFGLIRGQVAKARGNVSATGATGSVVNLGAVGAGQYLYAVVHVFDAGTTISLDLESDSAANFPSATVRASVGPLTAAGGTWVARVAGPITDTHYRLNVTAATGTSSIAAAIGIGS